jgi:hypothetical protein
MCKNQSCDNLIAQRKKKVIGYCVAIGFVFFFAIFVSLANSNDCVVTQESRDKVNQIRQRDKSENKFFSGYF